MGMFDFINKKKAKPKKGGEMFPTRYSGIHFERLGGIQSFDDNERTYIEEGYQSNPIVYSIVSTSVKAGCKAKWYLKDKTTGKKVSHPIIDYWLDYGVNPGQTWMDFLQDSLTYKYLTGNSFITWEYGSGINEGMPSYIYSLPPTEHIQINVRDDGRGIHSYDIDFAYMSADGVPANEVLHLKDVQPDFDEADSNLFGQSKFRAARRSIQAYNESLDAGLSFLANRGAQKILLNADPEAELSPEAEEQLKKKLRSQTQGTKNVQNLPIIDGDLQVLDVSSSAAESLVLEQRMQSAIEICNVLGMPTQMVGIANATYQNAKEAKKMMWENVILPELYELRDGLNRKVMPLFGDNLCLEIDLSGIDALQEDMLMRGKSIKEFAGLITMNQALEMSGLPKYEWMDEPTNMEELKEQLYVGFTQSVVEEPADEEPTDEKSTEPKDNKE